MKPPSDKDPLHALLDDVVPSEGEHCGPARSDLLAMVRRERMCRRQVRVVLGSTCALLLVFGILWRPDVSVESPPSQAITAPATRPVVIQEVDDRQLLSLLKDTPAALMEWPDGQRTLLVVGR